MEEGRDDKLREEVRDGLEESRGAKTLQGGRRGGRGRGGRKRGGRETGEEELAGNGRDDRKEGKRRETTAGKERKACQEKLTPQINGVSLTRLSVCFRKSAKNFK